MTRLSGFFDLQVNGYAGVDFNATNVTTDQLQRVCAALRADGVAAILATVITDDLDAMSGRLAAIADGHRSDSLVREVIGGVHIEGPFINENPGYVGAHPVSGVRPADVDAMQRLLDAADGLTRMVTLAPECDPGSLVTRRLADEGIVVSAGHCNPSLDELRSAIDAGLTMFTHLGNGCPAVLPRHDNVVQRVLSLAGELWVSFIADGVHVPFFALRNYLDRIGLDRAIVVTDAIAAAGLGPGSYSLSGKTVVVSEDGVTRYPGDDSHLVGSAATMPQIISRLRDRLNIDENAIRLLVCDNPRSVLDF